MRMHIPIFQESIVQRLKNSAGKDATLSLWLHKYVVFGNSNWAVFCCLLSGPFVVLNSDVVSDELDMMLRSCESLIVELSNEVKPRKVALACKDNINSFKQYLPVLNTICNPGIKSRHWDMVSTVADYSNQVTSLKCSENTLFPSDRHFESTELSENL